MKVSSELANEIRDYITRVLNKDVHILMADGMLIASEDMRNSFDPSSLSSPNPSAINTIVQKGKTFILIPIKYQTEYVASIVLNSANTEEKETFTIIKSFAELFIQQYIATHKPALDSTDQFFTRLVTHATINDLPVYETEASVLGYDLSRQRISIVIELENFWEQCLESVNQPTFEREDVIKHWKKNIDKVFGSFFSRGSDNIIVYTGANRFIIFKSVEEDQDNVMKMLKQSHKAIFEPLKSVSIGSVTVGYSNPFQGIEGLIRSYREAEVALTFGMRLWGKDKSYYFGDLGILQVIGEGDREKELAFANTLLAPLTNPELIHTLEYFFDHNLNLTETAETMGIHRNTVIYRLNQISDILGIDPRIFDHAMMIKLALLIRRLFS